MIAKVRIQLQLEADTSEALTAPVLSQSHPIENAEWQFSVDLRTTGQLIELLLYLDQVGFETDIRPLNDQRS